MIAAPLGQSPLVIHCIDAEQGPLVLPGGRDHRLGDARTKPVAPALSAEEGDRGHWPPVIQRSPAAASDSLAGLLTALDLKQIVLSLAADGTPLAKLPEGQTLDAETRALLGANRAAIVEVLTMERDLWILGRAAQEGDPEAFGAYLALLSEYEERLL